MPPHPCFIYARELFFEQLLVQTLRCNTVKAPQTRHFNHDVGRESNMCNEFRCGPRKVNVRLPGNGNSNSHGARPVHLIITMIKWTQTSRLSITNSLSSGAGVLRGAARGHAAAGRESARLRRRRQRLQAKPFKNLPENFNPDL